jgi:hypothetical protein
VASPPRPPAGPRAPKPPPPPPGGGGATRARDAWREARHAAQLAFRRSPPASGHPSSSTSNKGFNEIKPFSWARGQEHFSFDSFGPGPTFKDTRR